MESNLRINDDVVVEILRRCPFKDLGRFKCVSKTWCFLISHVCAPRMSDTSPILGLYFRGLALSDHVPGTELLFSNENTPSENTLSNDKMMFEYVPLSVLSPANHHPEGEVIDSCGGLLLSLRKSISQYYVCNPLTKQSVKIPKACNQTSSSSSVYCGLAFDPCESLHFKIVRFTSSPSKPTLLDIYFSNIGKWVRPELQLKPHIYQPSSVYLKGVMYRLAYSNELLCLDLNIVNMHFHVLPKVQNSRGVGSLGIRMGRLSYVKMYGSGKIYIWSLEGDSKAGFDWCIKYIFSISDFFQQVWRTFKHPLRKSDGFLWIEPYAFHPNSDVIFLGTPRMIFSYDLCSKSLKQVLKTEDSMRCYHPYLLVPGCLASFKNEGLTQNASSKIIKIPEGMRALKLDITCSSNYQVVCPISGGGTAVYM